VRANRPNVLVLRTFSKAHGLAGVRLGYGCGDPELLRYFARVRNSFSISVVAESAGWRDPRLGAHSQDGRKQCCGAAWLMSV